jgi:hypothetical protein
MSSHDKSGKQNICMGKRFSPFRGVALVGLISLVVACGCLLNAGAPVHTIPETFTEKNYVFIFNDARYTVGVNISSWGINDSKYLGKMAGDYNSTTMDVAAEYYRKIIFETREESVYEDVLYDLRYYRDYSKMDNGTYVEFITAFVQSIPYNNDSSYVPLLPVETLIAGTGDCDDKSMLLAALLSTEGYATSLITVHTSDLREYGADHMGIGIIGGNFDNTGYMYIETTNRTPIGFSEWHYSSTLDYFPSSAIYPPDLYEWINTLHTIDVIRESGLYYENADKARDVTRVIESIKSATYCWKHEVADLKIEVTSLEIEVTNLETEVQRYGNMYTGGVISYSTYDNMYQSYKRKYNEYKQKFDTHNAKVREHNKWNDLFNYLIDNTDSIDVNYQHSSEWIQQHGMGLTSCSSTVWPTVTVRWVPPTIAVPAYTLPAVVLG